MQIKLPYLQKMPELIIILFLLFSYTKIHLTIPGFGIPYFFSHLMAALYLIKYGRLKLMAIDIAPWVFILIVHFLISSENAPIPNKEDIQTFTYNLLNMFSILTLFLMLRWSDMNHIEHMSKILMILMILFGLIEIYGGLKEYFDAIRSLYTSESSMYTAEDRDISQYGALRPNVFTSEPSSVGNFFGSLWVLYFSISKRTSRKNFECVILMAIAIFLFRSPTLILYIIVGLVINIYVFSKNKAYISWIMVSVTLFATMFLPYYLSTNEISFIMENEFAMDFVSTGSFYIRQIAPVENFIYMLHENPFFGYGYSYFDKMKSNNWLALIYKNPTFYDYDRIVGMHGGQFITNALWEFWVLNGLAGGLVTLIYMFAKIRKNGGKNFILLLLCSACVWASHAGISLIFTWIPIIFIAYALSINYTSK